MSEALGSILTTAKKKKRKKMVAHAYDPSYLEAEIWKIEV
jgi:hypothetical protein